MKKALGFALAVIGFLSLPAHAEYATGSKLIEWSKGYDRVADGTSNLEDGDKALLLSGYVMSVADSYTGQGVCAAPNVSLGQLVAVSMKYIKAHPEWWNMSASKLVLLGLSEAFPCKK